MNKKDLKEASNLSIKLIKFINAQNKLREDELIALCASLSCFISRESQDIEEAKILSGICLSNVNKFLEISMKLKKEKEATDEHEQ